MNNSNITTIVDTQKQYFSTGATRSYEARMSALCKLEQIMKKYEADIYEALEKDLGKSKTESFMCEVGLVQWKSIG